MDYPIDNPIPITDDSTQNLLTGIIAELNDLPLAEITAGCNPEPFGTSMKGKRPPYNRLIDIDGCLITDQGRIWLEICTDIDYLYFSCDNHQDNLLIIRTFLKYLSLPLGIMNQGDCESYRPKPNVYISMELKQ